MSDEIWEVEVRYGGADIDMTGAPAKFGTPFITLDHDDGPRVPLCYGPVELVSIDDSLVIRTTAWPEDDGSPGTRYGDSTDHRDLIRPAWQATGFGELRVSGFEERADGTLVHAVWAVRPFVDDTDPDPSA